MQVKEIVKNQTDDGLVGYKRFSATYICRSYIRYSDYNEFVNKYGIQPNAGAHNQYIHSLFVEHSESIQCKLQKPSKALSAQVIPRYKRNSS